MKLNCLCILFFTGRAGDCFVVVGLDVYFDNFCLIRVSNDCSFYTAHNPLPCPRYLINKVPWPNLIFPEETHTRKHVERMIGCWIETSSVLHSFIYLHMRHAATTWHSTQVHHRVVCKLAETGAGRGRHRLVFILSERGTGQWCIFQQIESLLT